MNDESKISIIKQQLKTYINKRKHYRIEQKLKKHFSNCQYSQCLNRFYICTHKQKLKKDSYVICTDDRCNNCHLYNPKYTIKDKQIIQEEFYRDINDPSICGNKEPKIAVLLWVIKQFQIKKTEDNKTIWSKIIQILKNGFVWK